jgi:2-polyprenyl-3-methyl-5-hydroxy-6-metoxy-1,4-benzoquinol methylase
MSKVVITMPAYRAEGTLAKTVADIPTGVADEIIVVDDASPDETVRVARDLGVHVYVHSDNRGYGGNQKTCYVRALEEGAEIVVLLHPDYQYDPKAVPLLIAPILGGYADVTFGSRFAGQSDPRQGGMPLYRFVGNRVTTIAENLMLGSRFTEMHSGLRAYTRQALLSLPFLRYRDDFAFDSQLLVDAATGGLRVVEVPIPTRYTSESSSISIARSLRYVAASVGYCGRQAAARGRRGRRSPVASDAMVRSPLPKSGPPVERRCVLCGHSPQTLVLAGNAERTVETGMFACTSDALAEHDDIVECPRCGMVSSIPSLDPREIGERYADVVDEGYLAEEDARRELFRWVLDVAGAYPVRGKRLLEIGAHMGLFLDVARERGWDAEGIEPSAWAVEEGRRRFGVSLRQGSVEELEAEPASADVVVSLDVLEHLVDPVAALERVRSVVDDEGLLLLSTVNVAGLHARLRRGSWPWFIRPHLHYFTPSTLRGTLERAGFRLVEWRLVPRSFRLSYVAGRLARSSPRAATLGLRVAQAVDPKVPVGWLGDVVLVVARPAERASDDGSR